MPTTVEIWTDINCPFCYLGKGRFDRALADFADRDDIRVVHRSFELDPGLPADTTGPVIPRIAAKYGTSEAQIAAHERGLGAQAAELGLPYQVTGRDYGNSFDMHRLLHLALELGIQEQLLDALYAANFAEPEPAFGDPERLAAVAISAGLPEDRVRAVLADPDAYADAVRADERAAAEIGVTGVPFFLFGGKYAVSGAQPTEVFTRALTMAHDENRGPVLLADADACGPDGCALPTPADSDAAAAH
ncbi:DsbA family oxidoreductase [Nocardia thailandica]